MMYKLIAVAAAGLAGSVALVAAGGGRPQADLGPRAAAGAQIAPVATMKPDTGPLPALPRVSFDPPPPMAVIQQVYEFAARHPEVLAVHALLLRLSEGRSHVKPSHAL